MRGCWVGLEEETSELVPGHGDLKAELGSVGGWVPGPPQKRQEPRSCCHYLGPGSQTAG